MNVSVLSVVYPYVNELMMAPWDKPEWYTNTKFDKGNNVFLTTRYSVAGKKEERRYFSSVSDLAAQDYELSSERLTEATNNFCYIPEKFSGLTEKELYAFEQCMASISFLKLAGNSSCSFANVFATAVTEESIADMDSGMLEGLLEWQNIGGQQTMDEFHKLSEDEKWDIMDYLEEFTLYEEVTVNRKT